MRRLNKWRVGFAVTAVLLLLGSVAQPSYGIGQ